MWGVGDEAAVGVEDGAGEVEALFDVGRDAGLLQGTAHLLGDGHEAMAKNGEHDGVDGGGEGSKSVSRVEGRV